MKITVSSVLNLQEFMEPVQDVALGQQAPFYHVLTVKLSVDTIPFYFLVVAFWVKGVLKLIKTDSVNFVIQVSTLKIIFAIPVMWAVLPVLTVITVLNVMLDTIGQLQMEDCVVLVRQDVQLVFNRMDQLYVLHVWINIICMKIIVCSVPIIVRFVLMVQHVRHVLLEF